MKKPAKSSPSSSLPEKLMWVGRLVAIEKDDGRVRVSAICLGPLCVHKMLSGPYWAVTSVTTGLRVTRAVTESEAKKIAEILYRDLKVRAAFNKGSFEQVIGFMPEWVRPWLLECSKTLVCTNPFGHMQRAMGKENEDAEDSEEGTCISDQSMASPSPAVEQRVFKSAVRRR